MSYQIFMAFKHLTKRRRKGFISLISIISVTGITLGVMALIVVMAVMSGFDRELKSKIVGMNPHIIIQRSGGIENADFVMKQIRSIEPSVESTNPYLQGQVIIRSSTNAMGAILRGVPKQTDDSGPLKAVQENLLQGTTDFYPEIIKKKKVGAVAIGISLARILRVRVGDEVQIISPRMTKGKGFSGKAAKTETFVVRGIFEMGMNEFDSSFVLTDLEDAQKLFNMEGRASGISVRLRNVDQAEALKYQLRAYLQGPFFIQTWQDLNRNFFSALKVEKAVMRVLLTLIVMVAAFNIISTLIMTVMEKTKEIGILRALGATRGGIQGIFLFEGFSIGAIGTSIGGVLGYYVAKHINGVADIVERFTGFEVFPKDIYYFNEIPVEIIPSDIFFIILFALIMALLAAVYPARQAGKVSPVEAIRYE